MNGVNKITIASENNNDNLLEIQSFDEIDP